MHITSCNLAKQYTCLYKYIVYTIVLLVDLESAAHEFSKI